MENNKTFKIMQDGNELAAIEANTEREALCIYLMNHEEMIDVMLWRAKKSCTDDYIWKLAKYDDEDNYIIAIEVR